MWTPNIDINKPFNPAIGAYTNTYSNGDAKKINKLMIILFPVKIVINTIIDINNAVGTRFLSY